MRDHAGVISDVYRRVLSHASARSGNGYAAREKVPSA
jgi:hypothetical protein